MSSRINLHVRWTTKTLARFQSCGLSLTNWDESKLLPLQSEKPPVTIEDIGAWLERLIEGLHYQQTKGAVGMQMQVQSIRPAKSPDEELAFGDHAHQCLSDGDLIIVDAFAVSYPIGQQQQPEEPSEEDIIRFRKTLRYDLNDRVLCFLGPRWLSGLIAGSAVPDEGDMLPYLVKTDPLAGLPQRTISVPADNDQTCTLEVCFDPVNELHLLKASAQSSKGKLRFSVGEKVVSRIRNDSKDGLERWVSGTVSALWPELPGERKWELGGVEGEFPAVVPYKVALATGSWIFCQRDHHTLIRREAMAPQARAKGTSKRMEARVTKDGTKERVDHETERRKRMVEVEESDSD